MPTQTKFICPSGGVNIDFSGVFEPLNGGSSYTSATNYKVASLDLTGIFHVSTSVDDRPSFNTGFKLSSGADLSTIFRRYGFAGITITSQPTNQVVVNNSTATFSITATALGTPTYQWYKNTLLISGAISATYTTAALTTVNDTDVYFCRVSYSGSSVDSNSVNTRIKPYITAHPSSSALDEGSGATVTVSAGGSATLSYQWYGPNGIISGANSPSYSFTLSAANDGGYYCKVTSTHDATGVNSNTATISILAPTITSISPNTGSYNYNDGDGIIFTVTATGTNLTYSFYRGATSVQSGSSNQYTFSVSETNNGTYKCAVSNNGGSVDSNPVTIVRFYQNSITAQPTNQTVIVNGSNDATFSISANGNASPTYQWQENDGGWSNLSNGARVSGATSSQLSILNVESGDNGRLFRCIVSNKKADGVSNWSDTASSQVSLTTYWITITSQPSGGTVNENDTVAIVVDVSANPSPTYRWQYSSDNSTWADTYDYEYVNGAGTGTDTMSFSATTNDIGYYRCKITNAAGTFYSDSAYVSVN